MIDSKRLMIPPIVCVLAGVAACTTAPETKDEQEVKPETTPALTAPDSMSDAEAEFAAHQRDNVIPADLMALDSERFKERLQQKMKGIRRLSQAYQPFFGSEELVERAVSIYRIGQLYLNAGCEMSRMEYPGDAEVQETVKMMLDAKAKPFLQKAGEAVDKASEQGENAWAARAEELSGHWQAAEQAESEERSFVDVVCSRSADAWEWGSGSALETTREACEEGDGGACASLAEYLGDDKPGEAKEYRQKACELGVGAACVTLAEAAMQSGDRGAALKHYDRACEAGEKQACLVAKVIIDPAKAADYRKGCRAGQAMDCLRRASTLVGGGTAPLGRQTLIDDCQLGNLPDKLDEKDAKTLCAEGDSRACATRAGQLFAAAGRESGGDDSGAAKVMGLAGVGDRGRGGGAGLGGEQPKPADLKAACEAGKGTKCTMLAEIQKSEGGTAVDLWKKACEATVMEGCQKVAVHQLENGEPKKAMKELRRLCKEGYHPACRRAGEAFARGEYVPKRLGCAASYLWQNCSISELAACREMEQLLQRR